MIARLAARHWKWLAIGALLIVLAITQRWGAGWKETAGAWKSAFQARDQAYVAAQAAAKVKAEARVREERATYQALAERVDNAETEMAGLRAAADRYARAHVVRRAKAADGSAGGAGGAGAAGAAEGDHRSGGDADVVVSRADFDTLVNNTARLKKAHDWGEDLVAAGLATKAD